MYCLKSWSWFWYCYGFRKTLSYICTRLSHHLENITMRAIIRTNSITYWDTIFYSIHMTKSAMFAKYGVCNKNNVSSGNQKYQSQLMRFKCMSRDKKGKNNIEMGSKRFKVAVLEDFYYILVTSSMQMYDVRQIFFNRIKDGNQWKKAPELLKQYLIHHLIFGIFDIWILIFNINKKRVCALKVDTIGKVY